MLNLHFPRLAKPLILFLMLSLGIACGLLLGKINLRHQAQVKEKIQNEMTFQYNFLLALIYIARIDGQAMPEKISIIFSFFQQMGYTPTTIEPIKDALLAQINQPLDLDLIVKDYKEAASEWKYLFLIKSAQSIARADGNLSIAEQNAINVIATKLGIALEKI